MQAGLFGNSSGDASKRLKTIENVSKSGKRDRQSASASAAPSVGLGMAHTASTNNKITRIDLMNFSKYTSGSLAFGYVLQILKSSLIISLPGGVTGTVNFHEISDVAHSWLKLPQNNTVTKQ